MWGRGAGAPNPAMLGAGCWVPAPWGGPAPALWWPLGPGTVTAGGWHLVGGAPGGFWGGLKVGGPSPMRRGCCAPVPGTEPDPGRFWCENGCLWGQEQPHYASEGLQSPPAPSPPAMAPGGFNGVTAWGQPPAPPNPTSTPGWAQPGCVPQGGSHRVPGGGDASSRPPPPVPGSAPWLWWGHSGGVINIAARGGDLPS